MILTKLLATTQILRYICEMLIDVFQFFAREMTEFLTGACFVSALSSVLFPTRSPMIVAARTDVTIQGENLFFGPEHVAKEDEFFCALINNCNLCEECATECCLQHLA